MKFQPPVVRYADSTPADHSWARWLNAQVHRKNKSNLIVVVGKTGSGKTWSAISICEIMSKLDGVPFTIDHIVFSFSELMQLVGSGKLKKGSKIIFDEPQCSISSKEHQSQANKTFNYFLSTFRHNNWTLFFCTPYETLLDKSTRRLFHIKIETSSIDRSTNFCNLTAACIEHAEINDRVKEYKYYLVEEFRDKDRLSGWNRRMVHVWGVPKPSKELLEAYEFKKTAFTQRLFKNITESLNKTQGNLTEEPIKHTSKVINTVPNKRKLTKRQEEVLKVLAEHDLKETIQILGVTDKSIYEISAAAGRRGWSANDFKIKPEVEPQND
jgi:ABC-type oligopeptide transport system ATPase subunit